MIVLEVNCMQIVNTAVNYDYAALARDIRALNITYPFLSIGSIGKSELGRDLYYIKLGNGERKVFYNGAQGAIS